MRVSRVAPYHSPAASPRAALEVAPQRAGLVQFGHGDRSAARAPASVLPFVQRNGARGSGVFTLSDDGEAIAGIGKTSGQEYT